MGGYIKRCFYPVGHGGFAAEFFSNGFVMVYDCGTLRKLPETQENYILHAFSRQCKKTRREKIIDVLFISHFDEDHISWLDRLNKGFEIKDVYMPFLTNCQQKIHQAFYAEGSTSYKLVSGEFKFSKNTQIHLVKPIDDDLVITDDVLMYPNAKVINSFDRIGIDSSCCLVQWYYIPFMARCELAENFWEACRNNSELDVKLLQKAYNHPLSQSEVKDALNYIEKNRKALNKVYKSMTGNSNGNSLMLFSGCIRTTEHPFGHCQAGCLYTGDADGKLGIRSGKDIFSLFCNKINSKGYIHTLQVPHHGSKNSWGKNMEQFNCKVAVVQCRENDPDRPYSAIVSYCKRNGIELFKATENKKVFRQQYDLTSTSICKDCAECILVDL
ncbi:MAG: hypothetical protein E7056_03245 [Lentisphaerae bacterium]|nr:hypothetical protein [Lentisphaerota bacterium]